MTKNIKTAIVTGAGKGIGNAVANQFASMGYSLGIIARNKKDLNTAAEKILSTYKDINVTTGNFDVSDTPAVIEFVKQFLGEYGYIDVLVNNAGVFIPGTSNIKKNDTERMMDVNFFAATSFVKAVLPSMKTRQSGYIINIASLCGVQGFADTGGYSASKFALVGYSESLAQELSLYGIKVTALCPSWVNTGSSADAPLNPEDMIQTDDIAKTVKYLLGLGRSARVQKLIIRC